MGRSESIEAANHFFQVLCNCGELLKRSLQILHYFRCNHIGVGKIGAVVERLILQPKDVEVSGRRGDLYGGALRL